MEEINERPSYTNLYKIKEHIPLFLTLSSIFIFAIGHVSAYFYYSSWGVDYFQWVTLESGVTFALSSPLKIISTISMPFLLLLFAATLGYLINKCRSIIRAENKTEAFNDILQSLFLFAGLIFIIYIARQFIIGHSELQLVRNKLYRPMSVVFSDSTDRLKCVYFVGTLGDVRVFSHSNFSLSFIQKDKIQSISYMFSFPPIKSTGSSRTGKEFNAKYDEQIQIWSANWQLECPSLEGYKDFDFQPEWESSKVHDRRLRDAKNKLATQ